MIKEIISKISKLLMGSVPIYFSSDNNFDIYSLNEVIDIGSMIGLCESAIMLKRNSKNVWKFQIFDKNIEDCPVIIDGEVGICDCCERLEKPLKENREALIEIRKAMRNETVKRLIRDGIIDDVHWKRWGGIIIGYNEMVFDMCKGIEYVLESGDWESTLDKLDEIDAGCWKIGKIIHNVTRLEGYGNISIKVKKKNKTNKAEGYKIKVYDTGAICNKSFSKLFEGKSTLVVDSVEEFETLVGLVCI